MSNYATLGQLATFLGTTEESLPTDADRLLTRATEVIQALTFNRIDVSDETHADVAQRATCAQVEYWIENGEDIAMKAPITSKTVRQTSVSYGGPEGANPTLAPRARLILRPAGLLYRGGTAS